MFNLWDFVWIALPSLLLGALLCIYVTGVTDAADEEDDDV